MWIYFLCAAPLGCSGDRWREREQLRRAPDRRHVGRVPGPRGAAADGCRPARVQNLEAGGVRPLAARMGAPLPGRLVLL